VSAALFESIARIARHEASARAIASAGSVVDIFPHDDAGTDHACSVALRDTGVLLPRVPIAVGALGFCAIPRVGDLVLVVFLDGDVNAPVVVGRLYSGELDPPKHADGELVLQLPPGDADPKLTLKIAQAEPSLRLTLPGDPEMSLQCEAGKAELRVGDMTVTLDGAGGGRAEIAAGSARITIKKDGDIAISSPGNLKLEADQIEISGTSKVKISSTEVEIN
jgi:phage baseplate assembly protein gpV